MTTPLTLISHTLCPYVQRAAIVLSEKNVAFERIYIDLADKPDWFRAASPLGKVPLLKVGLDQYLFESAPIVEFLDETEAGRLHPRDPVTRAQHRAYVEFASQILNGIGALYNARDATTFEKSSMVLRSKFMHLEDTIGPNVPFFAGASFSLVDAAFGPVFRYFDVIEDFADIETFDGLATVKRWRTQLANRPSVQNAVTADYPELLKIFLVNRQSWISHLLTAQSENGKRIAAER
jgi:glutathione S-transferase